MRRPRDHIWRMLTTFGRDERGATLVEFAVVLFVFLLLFFGLIDYGRMGFTYVMNQKALQMSARTAIVRPPACAGVPTKHVRTTSLDATQPIPDFGSSCSATNSCQSFSVTCSGDLANPTVAEIWGKVRPMLPVDATVSDLKFTYRTIPELGFLGGPFTPLVTVELTNQTFHFVSPLSQFAAMAGAVGVGEFDADFVMPTITATLPGEDLAQGTEG